MRDLRSNPQGWLLESASRLCGLCWQGDFGKGQASGSGVWSEPGANPCLVYGPAAAAGVSSGGAPLPNWKLGMVVRGDAGAEFVYARLVLVGVTDLLPGQGYALDKDFNATLVSGTNANNVLNAEVGVLNVWGPNTAAGTYFVWLQRAGHCSVQAASGSVATGSAETVSGVNGQFKFPATATAGQKNALPFAAYTGSSSISFTGDTSSGSPWITGIPSIGDLQLGQAITGTGLPANAVIAGLVKQGSSWAALIGTNTPGSYAANQNATANGTGVTFTVTSHVTANLYWPTLAKQN